MKDISFSEKLFDKLKIIEGKEIDEKIFNLLETNALMRRNYSANYRVRGYKDFIMRMIIAGLFI